MKAVPPNKYRVRKGPLASDDSFGMNGTFLIPKPYPNGSLLNLLCLASDDSANKHGSWEHVSVSVPGKNRCPNWEEMCFVKDMFFDKEECVIQYHPPEKDYVSTHAYTLHLWKKRGFDQPVPNPMLVGIPEMKNINL